MTFYKMAQSLLRDLYHLEWNNPKTGESFDKEAYVKSAVSSDLAKTKQLLKKGYQQTGVKNIINFTNFRHR